MGQAVREMHREWRKAVEHVVDGCVKDVFEKRRGLLDGEWCLHLSKWRVFRVWKAEGEEKLEG